MRLLGLVLLLGTVAPRARCDDHSFPVLPIQVLIVDGAPHPQWTFCSGETLRAALAERAYRWVALAASPGEVTHPDLIVVCAIEPPGKEISIQLKDPKKDRIAARYSFKPVRADLNAREIAQKLSSARKAVKAAEEAYLRRYPPVWNGQLELEKGQWLEAADLCFAGLRGDLDPAPLYLCLATAYAKLGRARHAYWYFLAHAKASGKKLKSADLTPILDIDDSQAGDATEAATDLLKKWNAARPANRYRELVEHSEAILKEAPWADEFYGYIAHIYREMGWKRLAKGYERRRRMAVKVNEDKKSEQELIDLLRGP